MLKSWVLFVLILASEISLFSHSPHKAFINAKPQSVGSTALLQQPPSGAPLPDTRLLSDGTEFQVVPLQQAPGVVERVPGDHEKVATFDPMRACELPEQQEEAVAIRNIFQSDEAKQQKQDVNNLHLYQLLRPVNSHLKEVVGEMVLNNAPAEQLQAFLKASAMCSQVLENMEHLVTLFNTKSYEAVSQFKWHFLSICQTLKDEGLNIKPHHLRKLAPRLKKFHTSMFNYFYLNKEFMEEEETMLFNEMNTFCSALRFCLLPGSGEYFAFSNTDYAIDTLVFKPAEWVVDHQMATAAGLAICLAGLWYWHSSPEGSKTKK